MIVESKKEDNQQLADEIAETILAELLQKELAIPTLTRVFKRVTPRPEVILEVMPSV